MTHPLTLHLDRRVNRGDGTCEKIKGVGSGWILLECAPHSWMTNEWEPRMWLTREYLGRDEPREEKIMVEAALR
eukprot:763841-Hanusia_phi.AAC.4